MTHPTLRLKRAYLAMRRAVDEAIRPFGYSAAQFDVIQLLLHQDDQDHRQLQEQLAMTSPTLTNILDGMVRDGMVERSIDAGDARRRRIRLGAAARATCASPAFSAAGNAVVDRMFKGFSDQERAQLLAFLDRAVANLDDAKTDD
jgi:DNA-binding MarR family transcriptional regulator